MDEKKLFIKNDLPFVCGNCGAGVPALGYTSRNHCPRCLYSMHLDFNPGDRSSGCGGLMRPLSVVPHPKKDFVITHKCVKCGKLSSNRSQADDDVPLLIKYTNPDNLQRY